MEESVWIYFGVIVVIVTIGIITTIFTEYKKGNDETVFFDGLQHLGEEVSIVCSAPKDTMLSLTITIPSNATIYAKNDRLCGTYGKTRCVPSDCPLQEGMILDLTQTRLFSTHKYSCAVLHNDTMQISCQG